MQRALIGDALDDGPALIFVADDRGRYAAVNSHACEVLGYTRAELLGMQVTDVAAASEAPELYREMLRDRAQRGVTTIRCKDGRELEMRYEAAETTVSRMTFYVSIGFLV